MFIVRMELDLGALRGKSRAAMVVSHASIVFPFLLGMVLALASYRWLAPEGVSFLVFSLFLGIALSITAFPVLARILQEKGMARTPVGALVLSCAAFDDITAWCILALILAVAGSTSLVSGLLTLLLSVLYAGMMLLVLRPLLGRAARIYTTESLPRPAIAAVFILVLASALATEWIGVHALFGAFLAGVIMPRERELTDAITEKVQDFSVLLLLPLFFAFTGLRTEIGLLHSVDLWFMAAGIVLLAVVGKFGGSFIAARLVGESWKTAATIGILMNTRGLMELVVLNIGYDLGIISREMFAMLVIMALLTTFMSGPLLGILERLSPLQKKRREGLLVAAGRSEGLAGLFSVARIVAPEKKMTIVHMSANPERSARQLRKERQARKELYLKTARDQALQIKIIDRETENVTAEILKELERFGSPILLLREAKSLISDNPLGGRVRDLLRGHGGPSLIYLDRGLESIQAVVLLDERLRSSLFTELPVPSAPAGVIPAERMARSLQEFSLAKETTLFCYSIEENERPASDEYNQLLFYLPSTVSPAQRTGPGS